MEGEKIKEVLRQRGKSMSQLARHLNISQQTLSAALQGDDVRTSLMEGAADLLGESPAYFYTGENSGTAVVGTANQSTVIGKQESLTAVRVLERQLEIKDAQIDKLIDIIRTQK